MCGRYSLTLTVKQLESLFKREFQNKNFNPIYNAAPSQYLPVIANNKKDIIQLFRWGLIPYWAKDISISNNLINARAETISEKPSFKTSFKSKRCVIPSDGYYEWKKEGKEKIPYRIIRKDKELLLFAGIWDSWKNESGEFINSFSIITTQANNLLSDIHERMPVIIDHEKIDDWLFNDKVKQDLIITRDSDLFDFYKVSKLVNSSSNNFSEIIDHIS